MQNLDVKLDKITVGVAAHSDPLKRNKGITLIALIITIIVMLILVGVTINVALNGGLFTKAEDAAIGTEKQAIYEQIVSNMELTNDGKISVKGTFDKVIAEFGADKVTNINPATVDANTTEVTFSVVGKTGTYNYKISTTEIEKDPIQSPGGVQPPSQTGELVYGKVYDVYVNGVKNGIYCFYQEYNIVIADENFIGYADYVYDKTNGSVTVAGVQNFKLSDDGKSMYGEVVFEEDGIEVIYEISSELTDKELNYEPTIIGATDLYSGLYYNEEANSYICIGEEDENEVAWSIGSGDGSDATSLSNFLNNTNIKIIDNKHLELDGLTYTLVEELK